VHPLEGVGQLDDPFFVGPAEDDGPPSVLEDLLERHDLAGVLALARQDHVQGLVEDDLLPAPQRPHLDLGVDGHPHLAAAGEDVDGIVVVGLEEGAVGAGRLRELVDFLPQGRDVLLGLLEGVGQLLVLRDGLGQLALRLEEALFQGLDPARSLREAAAQDADFLLGHARPLAQVVDLLAQDVLLLLVRLGQGNHLPPARWVPCWRPYTAFCRCGATRGQGIGLGQVGLSGRAPRCAPVARTALPERSPGRSPPPCVVDSSTGPSLPSGSAARPAAPVDPDDERRERNR